MGEEFAKTGENGHMIKMVIFDKDGTLLDFDSFWVTVASLAVQDMVKALEADEGLVTPMLEAMGVENGVTRVDSVLCGGTYEQMGVILWETLTKHGVECDRDQIVEMTGRFCHDHVGDGVVAPTCENIKHVLGSLLADGRSLALVTTDGPRMTRYCLEKLDIGPYFSAICTDDGMFPPKPDPMCIEVLCEQFGYTKDEVIMVGDTMTDVTFAKNGGIRVIALTKTEEGRAYFAGQADAIVTGIDQVQDVLGQWEK